MRGICFKEPLFHASIGGRKDQTRRLVDKEGKYDKFQMWQPSIQMDYGLYGHTEDDGWELIKPRYKVDEVVYLKEPYAIAPLVEESRAHYPEMSNFIYKYGAARLVNIRWQNKLFMPAAAARYFIRITAHRIERLQDISDEDCVREGIESVTFDDETSFINGVDMIGWITPREAYEHLIDIINGKGTWDNNPLVDVYDYKQVEVW